MRGKLAGPLFLVGRGDPNLSNRKFPYELKEEFDGPPERVIAELADALAAKGIKEITGDIVGDDSYFPRERYPNGWEIDDMVWEYGAAISAIVVDDNTVATDTDARREGRRPGGSGWCRPPTPEFTVDNQVVTSAAGVKSDLTLKREPGANRGDGAGHAAGEEQSAQTGSGDSGAGAACGGDARSDCWRIAASRVDGGVRELSLPPGAPAGEQRVVLAEHLSIPLGDSVKLVNKISQNLHTEMLLRTAARQNGVWTTPEDLAKFPAEFLCGGGNSAAAT